MGTKLLPGEFDVYSSLLPDEPFFVIAARDRSAPEMLRIWARKRRESVTASDGPFSEEDKEDLRKATEADACADDMVIWRRENEGAWRETSQLRLRTVELSDDDKSEIARVAIKAVANVCHIPSQYHSSKFSVNSHTTQPWASPLINGIRHQIWLTGDGCKRWAVLSNISPSIEDMVVPGHLICDFVVDAFHEGLIVTIHTVHDR